MIRLHDLDNMSNIGCGLVTSVWKLIHCIPRLTWVNKERIYSIQPRYKMGHSMCVLAQTTADT